MEKYSQARKDTFVKRTQYYARPVPNKPKSYWKKENEKEAWHTRTRRIKFDTYPVCLNDVRPGQVGQYADGPLRYLKKRLSEAMEEN